MIDYFDFSKSNGKVFIPKARQSKQSTTFDKFHKSTIQSPSLDQYAKECEEREQDKSGY